MVLRTQWWRRISRLLCLLRKRIQKPGASNARKSASCYRKVQIHWVSVDKQYVSEKILRHNVRFLTGGPISVRIRLDAGQASIMSRLRYGENVIFYGDPSLRRQKAPRRRCTEWFETCPSQQRLQRWLMLGTTYLQKKISNLHVNRLVRQVFDRGQMNSHVQT
jgi:hypothetical protein